MTVLEKANEIINGDRQKDYGSATETHERVAAIWSQILGKQVSAEQVVLCMVGLKMARLCKNIDHEDSWMDIAGYVGVWDKMQRGE